MAKQSKKTTAVTPQDTDASPVLAHEPVPAEPVQLTIADLQLLSRIVDLASRRGAFQGNELSSVGEAFNKLTAFLAYVDSTQKAEAEAKAANDTPTA